MYDDGPDIGRIAAVAARALGAGRPVAVERVTEGGSTYVYRVRRQGEVFYLRVLPEQGRSFAPEALAHAQLRRLGVKVPEALYFERRDPLLGYSTMLTTAIPGRSLGYGLERLNAAQILVEAGRDLALINSIAVRGFGWIRRDLHIQTVLAAEFPTRREFLHTGLDDDLRLLEEQRLVDRAAREAVHRIVARYDPLIDREEAHLAHGDFDPTHIFHEHGRYTGIIDFGEIRGAERWYDLGHFKTENSRRLPDLLAGYGEITPCPPDMVSMIRLSSLPIAISRLARAARKGRPGLEGSADRRSIHDDIAALLW